MFTYLRRDLEPQPHATFIVDNSAQAPVQAQTSWIATGYPSQVNVMMWASSQLTMGKHKLKIVHDSPTVNSTLCIDMIHVGGLGAQVMDMALGKVEPKVVKDGKAAGIIGGVFGALLIASWVACFWLWKRLKEANRKHGDFDDVSA